MGDSDVFCQPPLYLLPTFMNDNAASKKLTALAAKVEAENQLLRVKNAHLQTTQTRAKSTARRTRPAASQREIALALALALAAASAAPRSHPAPARNRALRGGGPCLPSAASGLELACATTAGDEAGPDQPPSAPGDADPETEHMAAGQQGAVSPAQLAALAGRTGGGGALLRVLQSWEQAAAQSPAQMIPEQSRLWQTHDLTVFEDMLRDSPKDADIWSAYGHAHLAGHNDHTRAVEAYSRAIELAPSHSFALNNLGYILMKHRNDLAAAEGCFRKALQVAPADVNTNVNLAVLLSAHRQPPDYNAAAECYQRAIAVDDKHIGALVNYANFLVERPLSELDAEAADAAAAAGATNPRCSEGMHPSALRALRKSARKGSERGERPDGPVLREGQKDDSGEGGGYTWEELTRERPRVEEKAAEAAVTYWIAKAQDWNAAALYYERALEVDPGSADAMCGYASLKRHEDDAQGAESLYRRALVANPLHLESRSQYGLLLHKQNLLQRAREQYEKALAIDPQDPKTCLHLAALLEMVHAPVHEIVRLYKQILLLQPARADIYHSLGRVLQESGKDMQGAKGMFELALDYDPRHVSSLNSLALISQYHGESVAAQMYLQKALRLAPDQHALHCNYAAFLQRERKEYDVAEEHYERALFLKPNHLQTLCCYGSFLHTVRHDPQEALILLKQALHLAPDMTEVRKSVAAVERELAM